MHPIGWIVLAHIVLAPLSARADGWGLPSSRWGIGFGNSREFAGLRFNVADEDANFSF